MKTHLFILLFTSAFAFAAENRVQPTPQQVTQVFCQAINSGSDLSPEGFQGAEGMLSSGDGELGAIILENGEPQAVSKIVPTSVSKEQRASKINDHISTSFRSIMNGYKSKVLNLCLPGGDANVNTIAPIHAEAIRLCLSTYQGLGIDEFCHEAIDEYFETIKNLPTGIFYSLKHQQDTSGLPGCASVSDTQRSPSEKVEPQRIQGGSKNSSSTTPQ